jgi:hypothetical protein
MDGSYTADVIGTRELGSRELKPFSDRQCSSYSKRFESAQ